jgi:hypothetical protein
MYVCSSQPLAELQCNAGSFVEVAGNSRGFTRPLHDLQRRVRRKVGGEAFWSRVASFREKHLSTHDQAELTVTESLRSIASVPNGAPRAPPKVAL